MKVKELIEHLKKFDPEMSCVTIIGDCDEVYEAGEPYIVYVDDGEDPNSWGDDKNKSRKVQAVRV